MVVVRYEAQYKQAKGLGSAAQNQGRVLNVVIHELLTWSWSFQKSIKIDIILSKLINYVINKLIYD